jgi:hypothetical protein
MEVFDALPESHRGTYYPLTGQLYVCIMRKFSKNLTDFLLLVGFTVLLTVQVILFTHSTPP